MRLWGTVCVALAVAGCGKSEMKGTELSPSKSAAASSSVPPPAVASSAPPAASSAPARAVDKGASLKARAEAVAGDPAEVAKFLADLPDNGERTFGQFLVNMELAKRGSLDEKTLKVTREQFARQYEHLLLRAKKNPDEVSVKGTKLVIKCFLCSRQFLFDLGEEHGSELQDLGFTGVDCESLTRVYSNTIRPKAAK